MFLKNCFCEKGDITVFMKRANITVIVKRPKLLCLECHRGSASKDAQICQDTGKQIIFVMGPEGKAWI